MPSTDMLEAMGAYNEELVKAGVMLDGDGLRPSSYGARVRFDDEGNASVIDGPFAETKELVSGYWVFEVSSKEEAVEWARKAPFRGGELEIRPFSVRRGLRRRVHARAAGEGERAPGAEQPAQRVSTPPAPTASATADLHRVVDAVWRMESARIVGALTRVTGDVGLAEELAQDALVAALEQWPESGVPAKPGAWLMAIAKHRAIDSFRRSQNLQRKTVAAGPRAGAGRGRRGGLGRRARRGRRGRRPAAGVHLLPPGALPRGPGGPDPAAGRRPRAPTRSPGPSWCRRRRWRSGSCGPSAPSPPPACRSRCRPVRTSPPGSPRCSRCSTWSSTRGTRPPRGRTSTRPALCQEAMRLGRILAGLVPGESEVHGLVALMELQASRLAARIGAGRRVGAAGRPGPQPLGPGAGQPRAGRAATAPRRPPPVRSARTRCRPGSPPATPAPAASRRPTGRPIAGSYEALAALNPSPVIELNRAVAVSRAYGPAAGLELVGRGCSTSRRWPATTCCPPCAGTCSCPWAATTRRGRSSSGPRRSPATSASARSCSAGPPTAGHGRCRPGSERRDPGTAPGRRAYI